VGRILVAALCAGLAACGPGERSTVEVEEVSADGARSARPPVPAPRVSAPRNAEETARAVDQTHEVVSALMAEITIDASDLRVATDEPLKQVVLAGRVPSTRQRDLAERLARENAPGYSVKNELLVAD
jgi:osmotically-inducible protein OsmY